MTLSLVDAPSSIQQFSSGLVAIRAEDFVGPARGDLSVVSDSESVAGSVVKEQQALVVPSTLSSAGTGATVAARWALASDTLRIPVSTLSPYLSSETSFHVIAGLKVVGDVPSNARYKKSHRLFGLFAGGAAVGIAWGRDTTQLAEPSQIFTSLHDGQFKFQPPPQVFWSGISSGTNLVMRAWGVTGGTIELHIDVVYLMPLGDLRIGHFTGDYGPFQVSSNGGILADEDNDDTDNVIGQFSVGGVHFEGIFSSFVPSDFQDSEDEPTVYNATTGDWGFDPLDPKSWLSFIAAPHYVPSTSLISEGSFAGAITAVGTGTHHQSSSGYLFRGEQGNFGGPGHPSGTGWRRDGGGRLRCGIPSSASSPTGTYAGFFPHAELLIGSTDLVSGSSTDPRNYTHTLLGLEDFIIESTFECDTGSGEVNAIYGFQAYAGTAFASPASLLQGGYGLVMRLTGGSLSAELIAIDTPPIVSPTPINGTVYSFATPSTLDASYTAGDRWRVKVERRRYQLRAKVWLDGTGEPGTWTFDEHMPFRWDESGGSGVGFIDYPYDTGWSGDTQHDLRPYRIWDTHQMSLPGVVCWPNATSPQQQVFLDEFYIDIDPAGATPIDMLVSEEDHDGSNRSNAVTIPFATVPSSRFIEGSLRKRHFSGDTLGFNILAWKDGSSGPELQSSAIAAAYELAVLGGAFRPHVYRRVSG